MLSCTTALRSLAFEVNLPDNDRGGCFVPAEGFEDEIFSVKHVQSVGGPYLAGNIIIEIDFFSKEYSCILGVMNQCRKIVEKYLRINYG